MYEISFNFSAPSRATGKFNPLPKYKKLSAFTIDFATFKRIALSKGKNQA